MIPLLLMLACSPLKDSGATTGDGGSADGGSADGGSGDGGGSTTGDGGDTTTGDGGSGDGGTEDLGLPDFALVDLNPNSPLYGQTVSPRDTLEQVSGWYFTHAS